MLRPSAFSMWFEGLNIGGDARQVLADYSVGGTARDVVVQGVNYGRAVVFWLIDEQQRVHDAKLMAYRNDGHRVQGWANTMRSICERSHVGPQLQATSIIILILEKYARLFLQNHLNFSSMFTIHSQLGEDRPLSPHSRLKI